jgi:hypothetical protein
MRTSSNAEAWYYLSKTLKHQNTNEHGFQIEPDAYFNHEFIIGQNFEKVEGASFSGINTKMGDLMTIKIFNQSFDDIIAPKKKLCCDDCRSNYEYKRYRNSSF